MDLGKGLPASTLGLSCGQRTLTSPTRLQHRWQWGLTCLQFPQPVEALPHNGL